MKVGRDGDGRMALQVTKSQIFNPPTTRYLRNFYLRSLLNLMTHPTGRPLHLWVEGIRTLSSGEMHTTGEYGTTDILSIHCGQGSRGL